jgi:hypothetical protein
MALNKQSQKDVQDTATYIEDTLKSVSANLGEVFKQAVESAFDGVDATVMTVATKDFTRAMAAAAKTSEDLVKNHYRISQGLTTSKNLEKQLQTIAERKLELERKYAYTKQLAEDIGKKMTKQQEKAFGDAQAALDLQERILEADRQSLISIEKKVGLTGKLVSALGKIPGIGQFLKADEIDQEMRKAAANGASKFQTMGIAGKMVGKQLLEGLFDPLAMIGAIWSGFMRVNKATVDVQRLTGQYETSIAGVNDRLATSAQFLETAAELTKQWGVSATLVFTPDQIGQIAEAKNLLGLSAEQAGRMGMLMQTTGKSADQVGQGIYDTVNAFNGANRAGIAHGVVLQDVLSASDSITASLGNSEKKIGAAAVAARGLGLSLNELDDIAGSFLNFEDSISAELEAQLLTGKNINLSKARELALNNDLEGVANELSKNGASAVEYANMNRLEQESLAKAMGMSRDQLAKSVLTQEAMKNMTDEQIAKARGVTLEQSKAMDVQEKMQVGMQKLAEAFAPVLDVVVNLVDALMFVITPVAKLIAMVVGNPIGKAILLAVVAANFLGVAVSGVGKAFGSMYQLGAKALSGLTGLFKGGGLKDGLGGLKDKLVGGFKGAGGDKTKDLIADKAQDVSGATDKASSSGTGEKFKEKMQNIAEGIKAFGNMEVLFGAVNLIPSSIGLIAMIPGVLGAKLIEQIDGEKLKESLIGLGTGISEMGKGTVLLGALGLITTSIGLIAMIPGIAAGLLLAATAKPISMGLEVLGKGLEAFGESMMTGYGLIGLAAVAVGALALGAALNLAAPGIEAFGTVVTAVFAGLATLVGAVAEGFVTMMGAVTMENILPMMLLGPALFGIAAGLAAIAIAGPMAIPALIAVTGLAAVAGGVAAIFGGGDSVGEAKGKSEEGSMAAVEAKLTELIAVVKAGGNVYLDTNKVGRAQVLGSYKSS